MGLVDGEEVVAAAVAARLEAVHVVHKMQEVAEPLEVDVRQVLGDSNLDSVQAGLEVEEDGQRLTSVLAGGPIGGSQAHSRPEPGIVEDGRLVAQELGPDLSFPLIGRCSGEAADAP